MKKLFFAAACVFMLASCNSVYRIQNHTATTAPVGTSINSVSIADLEIGNRTSFTYATTEDDRHGGANNCKAAAIEAMLKANGNADILVSPEYNFDSQLNTITVTGRPAKYKNFRSAN
ncbi:MAG: hypothetical protein NC328_07965 [Muribaculum sp.]|nr:hypothetical protein [Muribaculum sp.]